MVDPDQDRMLPIANVGRIMKQILPATAKISKEGKQTMQECATEFISFVTGEASDKCHKENRKTVNGDDICWALTALGFDNYAEVIVRYLHKFREAERDKANQITSTNNNPTTTTTTSPSHHPSLPTTTTTTTSTATTTTYHADQDKDHHHHHLHVLSKNTCGTTTTTGTPLTLMEFKIIEKGSDQYNSLMMRPHLDEAE
ncbi:nuclear transcription factor Y subunit B-4-like [Humulus lupulus]|uniref:nuclear transcription factor Y subunit B-4-like n=1 Tax=Humulus lupulus TaxID=3486 RepID=UPI002B413842|nr:nuclear transcription factor Y subunit B-4-like [Humulus lupulus]